MSPITSSRAGFTMHETRDLYVDAKTLPADLLWRIVPLPFVAGTSPSPIPIFHGMPPFDKVTRHISNVKQIENPTSCRISLIPPFYTPVSSERHTMPLETKVLSPFREKRSAGISPCQLRKFSCCKAPPFG